jgi:hypothetical protein
MGGDGTFDADTGGNDYAMSALKLSPSNGTLSVVDYFTPFNEQKLSSKDLDLGSGGLILLPKQAGRHPQEMIGADKTGAIFVMDRNQMGKFHAKTNKIVQQLQGAKRGYNDTAAYWQGSVYFSGDYDYLSMYSLTKGKMSSKPVSQALTKFNTPGSTPSVSSNGKKTGIIWAIERPTSKEPAVLHAYDATNLANELYNSAQAGNRDTAGLGNKFQVPTVANGKVYVGTQVELDVYGPLVSAGAKLAPGEHAGTSAGSGNNVAPRR